MSCKCKKRSRIGAMSFNAKGAEDALKETALVAAGFTGVAYLRPHIPVTNLDLKDGGIVATGVLVAAMAPSEFKGIGVGIAANGIFDVVLRYLKPIPALSAGMGHINRTAARGINHINRTAANAIHGQRTQSNVVVH